MKKAITSLQDKSMAELSKMAADLRKELFTLQVESRTNPPKDSNIQSKKKKQLAQLLTVMNTKTN